MKRFLTVLAVSACVITSATAPDFNCIDVDAFAEGVIANRNHVSPGMNPYMNDPVKRTPWLLGWSQREIQNPSPK